MHLPQRGHAFWKLRVRSRITDQHLTRDTNVNTPGTYSPDTPIPASQRVFGGRDLFSLWFSLGIGLMVLQTGALLAPGLGMSGSM
ncbi:hydroxymethylpyrimidine transporter CytX, partial [Pseudomonas syringae pv. actinidiae ICMP 18804]